MKKPRIQNEIKRNSGWGVTQNVPEKKEGIRPTIILSGDSKELGHRLHRPLNP